MIFVSIPVAPDYAESILWLCNLLSSMNLIVRKQLPNRTGRRDRSWSWKATDAFISVGAPHYRCYPKHGVALRLKALPLQECSRSFAPSMERRTPLSEPADVLQYRYCQLVLEIKNCEEHFDQAALGARVHKCGGQLIQPQTHLKALPPGLEWFAHYGVGPDCEMQ